jgi:DNA-binding NtrC family response regulator
VVAGGGGIGCAATSYPPPGGPAARPDHPVSEVALGALARRTERNRAAVTGKRVLWVDDVPRGNDHERAVLRSAGFVVHNVLSTAAALAELRRDRYDVVITDMDRGRGNDGEELAQKVAVLPTPAPVVCYLGKKDPTRAVAPGFFGLTDRPDELVHLLLDVVERTG